MFVKSYGGYEIDTDTIKNYSTFLDFIEDYEIPASDLLGLLVAWNGTQIITDNFLDNLFRVEYELTQD